MLIVPGELTTMAGRRLREAVRARLISQGVLGEDAYVVVAGPANTYSHYIATREEYGVQRYEGASTIYGPCECRGIVIIKVVLMGAFFQILWRLISYVETHNSVERGLMMMVRTCRTSTQASSPSSRTARPANPRLTLHRRTRLARPSPSRYAPSVSDSTMDYGC